MLRSGVGGGQVNHGVANYHKVTLEERARGNVLHTDGSDHDDQRVSSDREYRKNHDQQRQWWPEEEKRHRQIAERSTMTVDDGRRYSEDRVRVSRTTSAEDTRKPTRRVEEWVGNRHQYAWSSGEPEEHTQQQGRDDEQKRKSMANSRQDKSKVDSRHWAGAGSIANWQWCSQCGRDEEDRDPQDRKPEIRGYRKARNLRLELSTARSRLRGPRRVQVHVRDGRGVDGDGYDECENHVSAETESSDSRRCEVTPIQKMARKATEELKAAELKYKVQTVKKSLKVQQTVQQFQAAEEARAIAVKEDVESKGREAAVETSPEGGCWERGQSSTTNKAEGWSQDHRKSVERE